jgi:hypothetical protein
MKLYMGDNIIATVTRLRAGKSTICGSNPGKNKIFISSPKYPDRIWSPSSLLLKFSNGNKATDMWSWTLSRSNIEGKNVCIYTFITSYIFFGTAQEDFHFTIFVCLDNYNSIFCLEFAISLFFTPPEKEIRGLSVSSLKTHCLQITKF